MARRARTLWRELEAEAGTELLTETGVSWFAHREDGWEAESERALGALRIPTERWTVEQAAARFPSLDGRDLAWVLHEPEAGVLQAQKAVQTLARQARARSARLIRGRARPAGAAVALDDGRTLEADRVVWCAGSWLTKLFPELVRLRVTRQELFFFDGGAARRDAPAWVDYDRATYGTGDLHALRALRRQPLHFRRPPRARPRVAGRRRLGPRLQARPGDGRAARHGVGRRRGAPAPLRARGALAGRLVQERGL